MDDEGPIYLTAAMTARRYGGVTPQTLRKWEADPRKRFPKSIALGRWNWGLTDGHGMLIGLAWAAAAVLIGILVAVNSQPRR